jgi:DNA topoisomerase-1
VGTTVSDKLTKHFGEPMDVSFTADMEERLDAVAEGSQDWVGLLKGFTGGFYPTLDKAKTEMEQVKGGVPTDIKCELCGKPMTIRFGKNGEFLGCSGYPDCKNIRDFTRDEQGNIQLKEKREDTQEVVGSCPECGKDLILKRARTGSRFIGCSGYPDCKHTAPFSTGVKCPREKCDGELVEKSSRRGKLFYSCNTYPKCDFATWDWPVDEPCPECDSKVLTIKKTKAGLRLACPSKGCRFSRSLPDDYLLPPLP